MRNFKLIGLMLLLLAPAIPALAGHGASPVSIEVVDDHGDTFRQYPLREERRGDVTRAWLEAEPGAGYAIRVRNRTPDRIGLVIAVDGRNIISGKKSKLKRKEKMYVLGPHQSAVYRGWRTGRNRVNEFFFTSETDSYAGAFGDYSAMGVMAVAVFRDRAWQPREPHYYDDGDGYRRESNRARRSGKSSGSAAAPSAKRRSELATEDAPGTGFGDERYSPSRRVKFEAERNALHKSFIKYEWRETLCEKGIARCYARDNRFWPRERHARSRGFAAYPPGYRYPQRDDFVKPRRYR